MQPKRNEEIVVNIDEWMKKAHPIEVLHPAILKPEELSPEESALIEKRRTELVNQMNRMDRIRVRGESLDADPRECTECGTVEAHYKGDYVCFECRDKMEEADGN